jgi:hypothetical protein
VGTEGHVWRAGRDAAVGVRPQQRFSMQERIGINGKICNFSLRGAVVQIHSILVSVVDGGYKSHSCPCALHPAKKKFPLNREL